MREGGMSVKARRVSRVMREAARAEAPAQGNRRGAPMQMEGSAWFGTRPFILGRSKLGDGHVMSGPGYFLLGRSKLGGRDRMRPLNVRPLFRLGVSALGACHYMGE
jgi:hypothetical protein